MNRPIIVIGNDHLEGAAGVGDAAEHGMVDTGDAGGLMREPLAESVAKSVAESAGALAGLTTQLGFTRGCP